MPPRYRTYRRCVVPCRCVAYAWPHRTGAGLYRWPKDPIQQQINPVDNSGSTPINPLLPTDHSVPRRDEYWQASLGRGEPYL